MESVSKNTFFGLKMIVKSYLEKDIVEIPPCEIWETIFSYFIKVSKNTNSVIKLTIFPHRGISKQIFLDHTSPSFSGQKMYFWIQIPF